MSHVRVRLADTAIVAGPGPLPAELRGLADESLADLSWTDPALGHVGHGYWPCAVTVPAHDPATHREGAGFAAVTVDPATRTAAAVREVVALTPEELAARPPAALTRLEFLRLVQTAGGVGDAALLAAMDDPALRLLWKRLELATAVERDHPDTATALATLVAAGHLTEAQTAAIRAAWPPA